MQTKWITPALAGLAATFAAVLPADAVTLVKDGAAAAEIVIPAAPLGAEERAAEELAAFLRKSSGCELPVVRGEGRAGVDRVLIGRAAGLGRIPDWDGRIAIGEHELKIAGGDSASYGPKHTGFPCGTVHAVYEFLDRELHLRFLWPEDELGTVIDRRRTIVLKPDSYEYRHPFESVSIRNFPLEYARSAARMVGTPVFYPEGRAGHAFVDWWKRYAETHPEFFEMLNGRRNAKSGTSMCVANPAFHAEIVRLWREAREKNPKIPYSINACENDTSGRCACPMCRAWDDPEADPAKNVSARYARFYGAVYDLAAKTDPSVRVYGYAYANYVDPPRGVRLPENVNIAYVPDSLFPYDAKSREKVLGDIRKWQEVGCTLNYRPNILDGYAMPHEISADYYAEFQEMRKAHMKTVDVDGPNLTFSMQGPFLYMLARMMTHPELSYDRLMDEYCGAFGPASREVRAYWEFWGRHAHDRADLFHSVPVEHNRLFHCNHYGFQYAFYAHILFPEEMLRASRRFLERAVAAAKGSPDDFGRVKFLLSGLDHAILCSRACRIFADERTTTPERIDAKRAVEEFRKSMPKWAINPGGYSIRPWFNELAAWHLSDFDPKMVVKLPLKWRMKVDTEDVGESAGYGRADFDDSGWGEALVDRFLGMQEGVPDGWTRAWYRTSAEIPERFRGCRTEIRFGRVDESCVLYVNGREAARFDYNPKVSTSTMNYPMTFDITGSLEPGRRNVLSVKVTNVSGDGGLWQPVELRFHKTAKDVYLIAGSAADDDAATLSESFAKGMSAFDGSATVEPVRCMFPEPGEELWRAGKAHYSDALSRVGALRAQGALKGVLWVGPCADRARMKKALAALSAAAGARNVPVVFADGKDGAACAEEMMRAQCR